MADKELKKSKMPSLSNLKGQKEKPRLYAESDEWYMAEFEEAEMKKGQYGPYTILKFKLLNGKTETGESAKGMKINVMMDATVAPGTQLHDFLSIMKGHPIKENESVNVTSFYGNKYRAFVTDKKKKKGQTDGPRYQTIKKIKRRKKPEAEPAKEE